jgi:hypothetical protein
MIVDALGDLFDILPHADRMAATPHGRTYLDLLHTTASAAALYAQTRYQKDDDR